MAGSLLLLLDDIATVLDDVATMTKVAAKKTAGVVGDDLALNAKQLTGLAAARELPVVWGVARGSALNKLILVPAALGISWLAPWAIGPLLVIGGAYLCFEGAEKILHRVLHPGDDGGPHPGPTTGSSAPVDPLVAERGRIASAVRTDFILSAEIIVITLGVVAGRPLVTQLAVLAGISIAMTIGVYGLVAGMVKLDDLGAALVQAGRPASAAVGRTILAVAPWLMRTIAVAGTAAMFLVGGGIIAHAVPVVHATLHERCPPAWLGLVTPVTDALIGLAVGAALVGLKTVLTQVAAGRGPR